MKEKVSTDDDVCAFYFDGRKDRTKLYDTNRIRIIKEEHISLIEQPGSYYISHITPPSGTATAIANLDIKFRSTSKLIAIGCDGENVNTGNKNGIITQMEKKIQKPVHWIICQLHTNELPLRKLITTLNGKTSGPNVFAGPICSQLNDCEKLLQFNRLVK